MGRDDEMSKSLQKDDEEQPRTIKKWNLLWSEIVVDDIKEGYITPIGLFEELKNGFNAIFLSARVTL